MNYCHCHNGPDDLISGSMKYEHILFYDSLDSPNQLLVRTCTGAVGLS